MCLKQRQIFHGHRIFQHFYHVASFKSINIDFETGTSTTADLIPYPFGSGIEEQTPDRVFELSLFLHCYFDF